MYKNRENYIFLLHINTHSRDCVHVKYIYIFIDTVIKVVRLYSNKYSYCYIIRHDGSCIILAYL